MFTVESFSYAASNLTIQEASQILKRVVKGNYFYMHYFSPYYGEWRNDEFSIGQGSLSIKRLKEGEERIESLSFNIVGKNPL